MESRWNRDGIEMESPSCLDKIESRILQDIIQQMETPTHSVSINHALYSLLGIDGAERISISEFIRQRVVRFAYCSSLYRHTEPLKFLVGGIRRYLWIHNIDGILIASQWPSQDHGIVAMMTTGRRWLAMSNTPIDFGIRYIWAGLADEIISDDELFAVLDTIPSRILMGAYNVITPIRRTILQDNVTIFPCDFPMSEPLSLPRRFVQEYCDSK